MAKVSAFEKNAKRKRLIDGKSATRKKLKAIISSKTSSFEERFAAQIKLSELPRNSSPVRYRNRCEVTGRPRGFYRKFKLSRIMLREMGSNGMIPGLIKSSW